MLHKAESEHDPVAREVLANDAPVAQEGWRCPIRTKREPDRAALDEKHIEALEAVERLTGARCGTCPNFYARLPWVHEAVAARRWRDKGAIRERCGWPNVGLVRAIDAIDRSDNARQADDWERRDREAKAERERMEREHNGSGST